jgi:hypothetical protein
VNIANILCFLCGTLTATVAATLYAMHADRVNWHNIAAARSAGYNAGVEVGKMQRLQRERINP